MNCYFVFNSKQKRERETSCTMDVESEKKGPRSPQILWFQLSIILILKEFIVCGWRKTRQVLKCTPTIYWTSTVKDIMINLLYIIFKIFTNALQGRYYPQLTNRETKCLSWLSELFKAIQLMRKRAPAPLISHLLAQLDPRGLRRQKESLLSSGLSQVYSRTPRVPLHGFGP